MNMMFLFASFQIFLIVYAAVILDMLISVVQAKIEGVFDWAFFPNFINKMLLYSLYLAFGNLFDYFAIHTGFKLEGFGLHAIAFVLILVEGASFFRSINELKTRQK